MDRSSPYSQPTFAVKEDAPLGRYRDPQQVSRFLLLFLGLHIFCIALKAAAALPAWAGLETAASAVASIFMHDGYVLSMVATVIALIVPWALCAWMWRIRNNARALGCEETPPLALLIPAALGLFSLGATTRIASFDLHTSSLWVAVAVLLFAAYGAYAIQQLFRASAAPTAWKQHKASPLLRSWLVLVGMQGLAPLALMQRYLTGRYEFLAYASYAQAVYMLATLGAEGLLMALVVRMARTQRATRARLSGE